MKGFAQWREVSAGDLGVFRGGSGFPIGYQGEASGKYPFFKVSDMNLAGNEISMTSANNYISESVRALLGAIVFPAGSIVFAKVGAAVFLERKRILSTPSCIDNNMSAFVVNPRAVEPRFVYHVFTDFKLGSLVAVGALPSLNGRQLRSIPVKLPPTFEEQTAISAALDDADQLVAATQRLLTKKRSIKQGMMQELLTGKTRLPGFSDEWVTKRLSEFGSFLRGRGIKRDDVRASGTPCIRYGELYTTYENYTRVTVSFVDNAVAAAALPIRRADVLFAGSGETKEDIGTCVAYIGQEPAVAGGDIVVFRGDGYDPVFLASLLNTPSVAAQKARGAQGDAVVHINWRVLAALEFLIPEVPEQRAIAQALLDADAEIGVLERRLESARAVKQGMMQELLTGRTRLVADGTKA